MVPRSYGSSSSSDWESRTKPLGGCPRHNTDEGQTAGTEDSPGSPVQAAVDSPPRPWGDTGPSSRRVPKRAASASRSESSDNELRAKRQRQHTTDRLSTSSTENALASLPQASNQAGINLSEERIQQYQGDMNIYQPQYAPRFNPSVQRRRTWPPDPIEIVEYRYPHSIEESDTAASGSGGISFQGGTDFETSENLDLWYIGSWATWES
ncbi:hypothetical protein TWF696_007514 [Orbilia brochopaga]|uniref:Uncharacterized protein n=1 Tax=Orbilia brochopaga TaxID=3140254 RepID=A0AAV9UP24_9PEZI